MLFLAGCEVEGPRRLVREVHEFEDIALVAEELEQQRIPDGELGDGRLVAELYEDPPDRLAVEFIDSARQDLGFERRAGDLESQVLAEVAEHECVRFRARSERDRVCSHGGTEGPLEVVLEEPYPPGDRRSFHGEIPIRDVEVMGNGGGRTFGGGGAVGP